MALLMRRFSAAESPTVSLGGSLGGDFSAAIVVLEGVPGAVGADFAALSLAVAAEGRSPAGLRACADAIIGVTAHTITAMRATRVR